MTHAPAPAAAVRDHDLLVFRLGPEWFAALLASVEEAVDLAPDAVQPLPDDNPALRGVVALRDALVPVFAPHRALGVESADGATALVVRAGQGAARAAILVDDVEDVLTLTADELRAATAGPGDVVRGVVQRDRGIVAIVDLNALVGACRVTEGGGGR